MKNWIFLSVSAFALTSYTVMASVPSGAKITDDTAIYQNLSEIRVKRQGELSFDGDLQRLASLEGRYQEKLPARANRVKGPMKKLSETKYRAGQKTISTVGSN